MVVGLTDWILAHGGEVHVEGPWWLAWNFDALILGNLLLVSSLYARGVYRIWQRTEKGLGISPGQVASFAGGIAMLVVALVSPVDVISAELSSVHMVQHMVLMMVAAPLLVLGSPGVAAMWALPNRWRVRVNRWLRRRSGLAVRWLLWQPAAMMLLYAAALWIWHWPTFYQAALRNRYIHDLQHLAFLITACLFWRLVLDPLARGRMSQLTGVIYLFLTSLHASALGVFMALSPRIWYSDYEATVPRWHLTPLEDQQLAGLIMWMPACLIYAIAAAVLFAIWLHRTERRQAQREHRLHRRLGQTG